MNATNLVEQAELRRSTTLARLNPEDRARRGQYFTPAKAAELLTNMVTLPSDGTFRVLDPGAGTGSLSAALVARLISQAPGVHLHLVCYELDPVLLGPLQETIAECETAATTAEMSLTWEIINADYIQSSVGITRHSHLGGFDLVLMNPPYGELAGIHPARRELAGHLVDTPNLYAAFMALGVNQLNDGGQLVAITPRSFANGPTFAPFRRYLLSVVHLTHIHDFASRSAVFSDSKVLQETIVIAAQKGRHADQVILSTSFGHLDEPLRRLVRATDVVDPSDSAQFIRIPTEDADVAKVLALPGDLASLNISVSTGKIVDFRLRENLMTEADETSVPMIYPLHFDAGVIRWPVARAKPQHYALRTERDARRLLPSGNYVVVKRFSTKEERRRVIAAVWSPEVSDSGIAFDNKTNVLHIRGAGMDLELARGLCIWLNSTPVDKFFRTFSGHTQVNATDMRIMRFPSDQTLRVLGASWSPPLVQNEVDELVDRCVFGSVGAVN